jgi:hypothetical protein
MVAGIRLRRACGVGRQRRERRDVPTLFRFLFVVGLLGAAVYGGMWGLATFVEPQQREMSQTIPASKLGGR